MTANIGDTVGVKVKASINGIQEDSEIFLVTLGDTANVEMAEIVDTSMVQSQSQISVPINLTTTTGEDLNTVTFEYELASTDVIENVVFSGTGASRMMSFDKVSSAVVGDTVDVTVKAMHGGIERDVDTFSVAVIAGFVCNPTNPLANMETDNGIYLIGDASGNSILAKQQLLCMSQHQTGAVLSANYRMTADVKFDINFSVNNTYSSGYLTNISASVSSNNEDWDGNGSVDGTNTKGWLPIGTFSGTFDGDGHKIENLYIYALWPTQGLSAPYNYGNNAGFFKVISGSATVKNLAMKNAFIHYVQDYACPNTGAIVGYNYGTITNSYVNGNVKSGNGRTYTCNSVAGAITGYNRGTITKSYSKGAVFSNSSNQGVAGGITGYNRDGGTISNSYSNVNVRGHGGDDGGLIGGIIGSHYTGSAITNCYATGSQALGNGGTGAGLIGSYGSAPLPTRSYAINNSYRAIGNADSNTTHYCSMSRDAGCSATAINSNWSSTIWSGLGTNNPTLKNMPN